MSHFSHIKTRIQNLEYLEKALNKLQINCQTKQKEILGYKNETFNVSLSIPQSNGYDIGFNWNGSEYELVADLSFWQQQWSLETFIDRVSQAYASETILNESTKQGFQTVNEKTNIDGSVTLVLERWK
jgi:hypothetical protein|tara:strand:+ start:263 stop:646 length:384 start_codon:yes stop_codon:yes gene_type:complete